jgi:hypothetical protein
VRDSKLYIQSTHLLLYTADFSTPGPLSQARGVVVLIVEERLVILVPIESGLSEIVELHAAADQKRDMRGCAASG